MTCPGCRTDVRAGLKFCPTCGTRLALSCPACSAPAEIGARFCGECGTDLQAARPPAAATAPAILDNGVVSSPAAVSERRVVSVLFADLVGFTPLSEGLDPEEVRELLGRYFDAARQVIGRYGGTVEKFIGDAVMAVWGTPMAREDDAERAVRAALELVAAIPAIGGKTGDLKVRAGVVTGEAATTVGAEGQGLAAGDVVNTASRIQSVAPPGGVLVDDATRRATERPIAYDDAGTRELKGKAEPVHVWQAMRVVAGIRGAARTAALEPPFVGRDAELRLVKELFHNAVAEGRARFVSVVGAAGVGKSRLSWEFDKYVDGLAEGVLWHYGRCLSYGEARQAAPHRAALRRRRRRAALAGTAPRSSARPRRPQRLGFRRPVLGMAPVLREAGDARADGDGLRGPAVGRRGTARLHRVPARLVARVPAVRADAVAAGADRPAAQLGLGQAQLHLDLPGAAA
jgi:class 3 adenylate cyclase